MKLTKIAYVALSAALVFGTKVTAAAPSYTIVGTTTDYLKLSFNLALSTQQPDQTVGGNTIWKYGTVKLTNKDILNQLAILAQTTWPAGAQLEYVFNANYNDSVVPKINNPDNQLVVADRTGTNILFFAGDEYEGDGVYGYFDFDPFDTSGVYTGHQTAGDPAIGNESYTELYSVDFEFYINDEYDDYDNYQDLYGGGSTTETYGESWTPYSDSGIDSINTTLYGGGYFQDYSKNYLTGSVLGVERWSSVTPRPLAAIRASKK